MGLFDGTSAAKRDLKKLKLFTPNEFGVALYQEALVELKEIKARTPVDTGALRASEAVSQPQREGRRIWVEVTAGGPAVPYAWTVHEDLEAFHKNGEAKFVERPLAESAPYMADRIARRIDLNRAL